MEELKQELETMKKEVKERLARLAIIDASIKEQEKNLEYAAGVVDEKLGDIVESKDFVNFFQRPYAVIPQAKNKVLVIIPKFVKGFQVGWLWKELPNYYIYQLDQYSAWLGDVPKELLGEINFKKEVDGFVQGDRIYFEPETKDNIKKKLGEHLGDIEENQARIKKGHIFNLIADMVEGGCLPFKPIKVSAGDLRESRSKIKLRKYQQESIDKFMKTGAIGVFHPTGAGKSFIALHLMDIIKGPKIIFVPTKTLAEQWGYYLETHLPHAKREIRITTYQGYRVGDEEYALAVYDECQRLPADTFSRVSVINTKYRIGLSASPHREDGRESYIFALTGFPIGLNWKEYMETVGRTYHPVYVHVVRSITGKLHKLNKLLDFSKKTFIFCDTIELGRRIANQHDIPFIYGQTNKRLDEVEKHKVLVVSRVMDLGVSIKDLERIIEVDFLFGSRQQELQRTGRLMHSEKTNVRHDILMTEAEISSYGKRLWSLQEKGFTIKMVS